MYSVERSADLPPAGGHTLEDEGPKPFIRIGDVQARQLRRLTEEPPSDRVDHNALIDEGSGYLRLICFEPDEGRNIGEALIFADGGCAGWQEPGGG